MASTSDTQVTIPALQQMKRDGKKSVGVVAWDYQIARIAERAGVRALVLAREHGRACILARPLGQRG